MSGSSNSIMHNACDDNICGLQGIKDVRTEDGSVSS